MKTTATNKKVRELISAVSTGALIPRPEFQRRLVWTIEDKNRFLETVLRNFPFPEIYIADGEVDLATALGTQLLVDGQQRITTLAQYFSGDPVLKLVSIPPYSKLDPEEQKAFLNYDVAVRDLGGVTREQILEVFQRINATAYSLNEMEINNAVFAGALKKFAESISSAPFFENHRIFTATDLKRMGDLKFALSLTLTMLQGYFNRDDALEDGLRQYNDEFPHADLVNKRIFALLEFIEECGFPTKSRIWKKADFFTALVELDRYLVENGKTPQPSEFLDVLENFFVLVDNADGQSNEDVAFIYYKAALQASNDRVNRVRRGVIIAALLRGEDPKSAVASFV